ASMIMCPKCYKMNPSGSTSCQKCGTPFPPGLEASQQPWLEAHQQKVKKQLRVISIVVPVAMVIIVLFLFFGPPNLINKPGAEVSVEQVISRDDAIGLATKRVQEGGVMSLDGRTTVVKEEQDYWHISFPISSPKVIGGEPHVLIDKASGTITRVYYTQ
ncbi:MAG: hypothetical protein V1932_05565, partial [Chloroflexota bacterium]